MSFTEYLTLLHGPRYGDSIFMVAMHISGIVAIRGITYLERTGTYDLGMVGMGSIMAVLLTYRAIDWMPTLITVFFFHWLHYQHVAKCNREMKDIRWHMQGVRFPFQW